MQFMHATERHEGPRISAQKRHMVHVVKRGGSWYLHWMENGRRHRRSLGRLDEGEAQQRGREAEAALERGFSVYLGFAHAARPSAAKFRSDGYAKALPMLPELFKQARKNASVRGIEFTMTRADMLALLDESGGSCTITGIPFDPDFRPHRRRPFVPSLDRIDNAKPYTVENCRMVCSAVNCALNEWGLSVLEEIAMAMNRFYPLDRVRR
jgi:hypothetical protein